MTAKTAIISLTIQKDVLERMDEYVANHKDVYSSRSHMINSSIIRELRRLGLWHREENIFA